MRKCCLVIFWLMAVVAGCHQSPYLHTHLELLNAEKRALEDELYDAEFDLEEACREIDKLKQQNAKLRGAPETPRPERSTDSPRSSVAPPMIDEGTLTEPMIELPPSTKSRELPMPKSNATPPPIPPAIPPRSSKKPNSESGIGQEASMRPLSLEPADPRVTHIVLNQLLTGGSDFDRKPGDDGIAVVVEPRNRDDAFVPLAGPLTIIVLDPAKTAEQGRIVARWEIDANEAQKALRNTSTVRGIELRLPWPDTPPQIGRLHLHVRYMTVDNRDLRTDRPLFIQSPGEFSQQWTPRAATRSAEIANSSSRGAASGRIHSTPDAVSNTTVSTADESAEAVSLQDPIAPTDTPRASPPSTPPQSKRPEWRPQR